MHKSEYNIKSYSSARSGRVKKVILAPPFLIYAVFGISILLQIPAGYIMRHFSFTIGMLLNQIVILLISVLIVIRFFGLTGKEVVPFKKIRIWQAVLAAVMMCSLAILSDYMIFVTERVLPISKPLAEIYKDLMHVDGVGSYIHKFLLLCIVPSFCEEVFFRGFCQTGLGRHYGRIWGILIVAAMFSVAHLSPFYIHIYFALGIFLGWIFATSGSLWIPIICHVINNFWTFTSYTTGWILPRDGTFGWGDGVIVTISAAVFIVAVYIWRKAADATPRCV